MENQGYVLRYGYRPILDGGRIDGEVEITADNDRSARDEANKVIRKLRGDKGVDSELRRCLDSLESRWSRWMHGKCVRLSKELYGGRPFGLVLVVPELVSRIHYTDRPCALTIERADEIGFGF